LSSIAVERKAACAALLRQVGAVRASARDGETALGKTKSLLIDFAAREAALFPHQDFAMPYAHGLTHTLEIAGNDGCGLYLTVNLPGKEAAPHAHGIWCINAGLSGSELHRFYRRTDDGRRAGRATVEEIGQAVVTAGSAMAMSDQDIHGTVVVGDQPARALALYGYALDRFPSVVWFHPQFGTCRTMPSRRA
jgi:predicted metal-dependent enzyme (double-stranded beta helix superfamily)